MSNNFDNSGELLGTLIEEELEALQAEEFDNIIVLNDENGNEVEFEFLDLIEYGGEEYVVLLPCDDSDGADEVVILRIEELGENNETYASVDDDDILQAVFDIFKDKFKDEFNFVD